LAFTCIVGPLWTAGHADRVVFVPARGHAAGATYAYTDVLPSSGVWWYWLADVDTSGKETFHSPVSVGQAVTNLIYQIFLPLAVR